MQDINEHVVMAVHFMSTFSVYSVSFGLLAKALLTVSGYKTAMGSHKVPFLQGFISCILLGSAGPNTVALLRGESIGLLKNTPFWLTFGVVYAMVFYNKTVAGSIQKAMSSPYFKTIFLALASMDRGNTMIHYGADGVTGGPDMIISKLVCGTLAACATDLWSEMFGLRQSQWTFTTPSAFFKFGSEMRISFFTIAAYLLLTFIFDSKIAHAWSVLFFSIANVSVFVNTAFSKKIKSQ